MQAAFFRRVVIGCAAFLATPVLAQTVTGSFSGGDQFGNASFTFTCTGTPTCSGTYTLLLDEFKCANRITITSQIVITGLNLGAPGPLQGTMTLDGADFNLGMGPNCSVSNARPKTTPYIGQWDGTTGTLQVDMPDDGPGPGYFRLTGTITVAAAPVFAMRVSGSIDNVSANVQAEVQFRPQDIGTTQSVYVFALAPAGVVRPMSAGQEPSLSKADALPLGCVLAQINATGQLQQVTASDMKALTTNALTAQGIAITVLNGVATVQIAGATFYVGYGATAAAMINNGINRAVATAPGAVQCKPEKPQTGWWWAKTEGGRGYSLEVSGNNMFFASYLYDTSGRATWYASIMPVSLDGSLFIGTLFNKSGGQTLEGTWRGPGAAVNAGSIALAFNSATQGTLVWPGGTVAIERFNIVANGVTAAPQANQPEKGWWWNPQEDGRGFYIEWQGGTAFVAGYMYDTAGNPLWYASMAATPNARAFSGTWQQYAGGQTLTGAYRPPSPAVNVAPVAITFQGADTGIMTLPGGRTTSITRFRF